MKNVRFISLFGLIILSFTACSNANDPNKTVESGIATGVATSASKIADFWLSQANSIFPIIEISAGRIGEVFLMEGADLGDLKVSADNSVGE